MLSQLKSLLSVCNTLELHRSEKSKQTWFSFGSFGILWLISLSICRSPQLGSAYLSYLSVHPPLLIHDFLYLGPPCFSAGTLCTFTCLWMSACDETNLFFKAKFQFLFFFFFVFFFLHEVFSDCQWLKVISSYAGLFYLFLNYLTWFHYK